MNPATHPNDFATVDFRVKFGLFFDYTRNFAENWGVNGATLRWPHLEAINLINGLTILALLLWPFWSIFEI